MQMRSKSLNRLTLKSVDRTHLPYRVASAIREAIFEQKLKPGDQIREIQLSRKLNVSRTPLREALRSLEQEGLVVRKPYCGVYVASMTEDEMRKVFRLRALLESSAIREARRKLTPDDCENLHRYIKAMKLCVAKRALSDFNRNDVEFHTYIWRLSGDEVLERTLTGLCRQNFIVYNIQTLALMSQKELMDLADTHLEVLRLLQNSPNSNRDTTQEAVSRIQNRWLRQMTEKLYRKRKPRKRPGRALRQQQAADHSA
jgi:DNA-binding GntR family transcriptional regulator